MNLDLFATPNGVSSLGTASLSLAWLEAPSLDALAAASLRLVIGALIAMVVLRIFRLRSPSLHRLAWAVVIVQSLLPSPIRWEFAVLPADAGWEAQSKSMPHSAAAMSSGFVGSAADPDVKTHLDWVSNDPEATSMKPDNASASLLSGLMQIWYAGGFVLLAWMLMSRRLLLAGVRRAVPSRRAWQRELNEIVAEVEIGDPICLKTSENLGPLITRDRRRYVVVVPRRSWSRLSGDERRGVLMHELAHLQRGDLWWAPLMRMAILPHWFNPIAWWIAARFDQSAEWDCDRRVACSDTAAATGLASALLTLSSGASTRQCTHASAASILGFAPPTWIRLLKNRRHRATSLERSDRDAAEHNTKNPVAIRIGRLINPQPLGDGHMKRFVAVGLAVAALLFGFVQTHLTAQAPDSPEPTSKSTDWDELADRLRDSDDPLTRDLADVLGRPSGQVAASDQAAQLEGSGSPDPGDAADWVSKFIERTFDTQQNRATVRPDARSNRDAWIANANQNRKHLDRLAEACRDMSRQIVGDGETADLVRRFLESEAGVQMLYMGQFRDRMDPVDALLTQTFANALTKRPDGLYQVREDAAPRLARITGEAEIAKKMSREMHEEMTEWLDDLATDDAFHRRAKKALGDPYFSAQVVATKLFSEGGLKDLKRGQWLDQLDDVAIETAVGLKISPRAVPEAERVIEKFEQLRERIERLQPMVPRLREKLADDEATDSLGDLMSDPLGQSAIGLAGTPFDLEPSELLRRLLSEVVEETDSGLAVRDDGERAKQIQEQLQSLLRQHRKARRHSKPIRDIAERLDDAELADAILSPGGMAFVRDAIEQMMVSANQERFEAWKQEHLEAADGTLRVRDAARGRITALIDAAKAIEAEAARGDF